MSRVSECLSNVQTTTTVNFEEGNTATAAHIRHLHELDAPEALRCGGLYLATVESFEVVKVSELAGLADAFAAGEAHVTIVLQALVHVFQEAHKEEYCADCRSCSSFARVAVHNQTVLGVRLEEVVTLVGNLI